MGWERRPIIVLLMDDPAIINTIAKIIVGTGYKNIHKETYNSACLNIQKYA